MKIAMLLMTAALLSMGAWLHADDDTLMELPDREPAAVNNEVGHLIPKRTYPGGADEDDLQVQDQLPEAQLKVSARDIQHQVYKELYKKEMQEQQQNESDDQ